MRLYAKKEFWLLILTACNVFHSIVGHSQGWEFMGGYKVADTPWMSQRPEPIPVNNLAGDSLKLNQAYKPMVREHAGGALVNDNEIYYYGGSSFHHYESPELWVYDISQEKWARVFRGQVVESIAQEVGIESYDNCPGALNRMAMDADSTGTIWMFGGLRYVNETYPSIESSSLWSFNTITLKWTYWGNTFNHEPNASPKQRFRARGWVYQNKFWIYGGVSNFNDTYNDLWYFDLVDKEWHFVSGDKNQGFKPDMYNGNYPSNPGESGVEYFPRARSDYGFWIHKDLGKFWFFGGFAANHGDACLGDMWSFDVSTKKWTFLTGTDTIYYSSSALPENEPGARNAPVTWIDSQNDLYLFGGNRQFDKFLNDIWVYNLQTNAWVLKDTSTANSISIISEKLKNRPGGRASTSGHIQTRNFIYLFGGYGYGINPGEAGFLGDIWRYPVRDLHTIDSVYSSPKIFATNQNLTEIPLNLLGNDLPSILKKIDLDTTTAGFQNSLKHFGVYFQLDSAGNISISIDSSINSTFLTDSLIYKFQNIEDFYSNNAQLILHKIPCYDQTGLVNYLQTYSIIDGIYDFHSNEPASLALKFKPENNWKTHENLEYSGSFEFLPGTEISVDSGSSFQIISKEIGPESNCIH